MRAWPLFCAMKNVTIIPLREADAQAVNAMLEEYARRCEECKPMDFLTDKNTELYVIVHDSFTVGMIRKTAELWRECHGKVGITVRPAERGKGYGYAALAQIKPDGAWKPTACVDRENWISVKMFEKAGWRRTGREFDWKGNRKAIEFALE